MKKLILLAILISSATGCSTVKQAKADFNHFQNTIKYHHSQPVVRNIYF